MPNELAQQLLDLIEKTEFPTSEEITPDALKVYNAAHDVLMMYRGHPDILIQALRLFLLTDVAPYAYAGAANVVMRGAYESGGKYHKESIYNARKLLEKAASMAPFRFEIDMIEARMHNMLNDRAKFRAAIDDLKEYPDAENLFHYASLELWYWSGTNNLSEIERWAKRARELASTQPQELNALGLMAEAYNQSSRYKESIDAYRLIVKMDPGDAWSWHNMSLIYIQQNELLKAFDCNRHALHIMEFGVAQNIQEQLIRRINRQRQEDMIDEVEPFPIMQQIQQKPEKEKKRGLFGGLFNRN